MGMATVPWDVERVLAYMAQQGWSHRDQHCELRIVPDAAK